MSCAICLEVLSKDQASPDCCDHLFCLKCLTNWSKHGTFCPVDRKNFKTFTNIKSNVAVQANPYKRTKRRTFYDVTTFCEVCEEMSSDETLLLCDSCDLGYHCGCLSPPVHNIPVGQWFCPVCVAIDRKLKRYNKRKKKSGKGSSSLETQDSSDPPRRKAGRPRKFSTMSPLQSSRLIRMKQSADRHEARVSRYIFRQGSRTVSQSVEADNSKLSHSEGEETDIQSAEPMETSADARNLQPDTEVGDGSSLEWFDNEKVVDLTQDIDESSSDAVTDKRTFDVEFSDRPDLIRKITDSCASLPGISRERVDFGDSSSEPRENRGGDPNLGIPSSGQLIALKTEVCYTSTISESPIIISDFYSVATRGDRVVLPSASEIRNGIPENSSSDVAHNVRLQRLSSYEHKQRSQACSMFQTVASEQNRVGDSSHQSASAASQSSPTASCKSPSQQSKLYSAPMAKTKSSDELSEIEQNSAPMAKTKSSDELSEIEQKKWGETVDVLPPHCSLNSSNKLHRRTCTPQRINIEDFVRGVRNPSVDSVPQCFLDAASWIGDLNQLAIRNDGSLYLNWRNVEL